MPRTKTKPAPQPPPSQVTDRRRTMRSRPVPRWLMSQNELDAIAQRRCLLVLSVLSGELPVSEAITQMQISRGMYYQLETRALNAMLRVLTPGASEELGENATYSAQIAQLEEKVKRLEQEKRRAERLALFTKKVLASGTVKTAPGRPIGSRNRPKPPMNSTSTSENSTTPTNPSKISPELNSTPTKDGAIES